MGLLGELPTRLAGNEVLEHFEQLQSNTEYHEGRCVDYDVICVNKEEMEPSQ